MLNRINFLITAFLIAAFVLLWHGYQFGHNDQVETLPYILWLQNKTLFQNDLFLQSLTAHEPNERSAFVYFMRLFSHSLETATLVLHIAFLVLLIAAMLRISRLFISNRFFAAMVVFVVLTFGYMVTLGGVDLYYNTFQGGNMATAICAWAIYFFLTKRYRRAALLLALASPFQILVGLNTFLWLGSVMLLNIGLNKPSLQTIITAKGQVKYLLQYIAIYSFTAGVFFLLVILQKEQADCNLSSKAFFDFIFDFRNAHHFLIAHFPVKQSLLFVSLIILGISASLFFKKDVFKLLIVGTLVVLVYALVTELTHFVPVASFQFYILTGWMKFFALLSIATVIVTVLPKIPVSASTTLFLLSVTCVVTATAFATNQLTRQNIPYEWSNKYKTQNPEIDICIKASELTDTNALFVHPFQFSALKYFGQRSAYAEFKAGLHQRCGVEEWYKRLQQVYGISSGMSEKGFALQEFGNQHLHNLPESEWQLLKESGVSHAILWANYEPNIKGAVLLHSNSAYAIWKL